MVKTAFDISRKKIYYCRYNESLPKIADMMEKLYINSVIVKNRADEPVGIVTVGDILKLVSKNKDVTRVTANDLMSKLVTIDKNADIDKLVEKFKEADVSRIILVDENKKHVGIVRNKAAHRFLVINRLEKEAHKRFGGFYSKRMY